jgi:hypothetical protein
MIKLIRAIRQHPKESLAWLVSQVASVYTLLANKLPVADRLQLVVLFVLPAMLSLYAAYWVAQRISGIPINYTRERRRVCGAILAVAIVVAVAAWGAWLYLEGVWKETAGYPVFVLYLAIPVVFGVIIATIAGFVVAAIFGAQTFLPRG